MKAKISLGVIILLFSALTGCGGDNTTSSKQTKAPEKPAPDAAVTAPVKPTPPLDSDQDGVADSKDRCPRTERGVTVDVEGCALDADGDGIADTNDRCPDTASGLKVDANGCRAKLKKAREFLLAISFPSGSSVSETNAQGALQEVIALATQYPESRISIAAYTDSSGPEAMNLRLSQQRADAVARVLEDQGFSGRVTATGHGEADPIADNTTREGRAKNRRIVAHVQPGN